MKSNKKPIIPSVSTSPLEKQAFGAFDGAARYNRDFISSWVPSILGTDAAFLPDKETIVGRVEDTVRNDAYIQGAVGSRKDSIVGSRYTLNARPLSTSVFGTHDPVWEREFKQEAEEKFTLIAESPDCWFDAAGKNTFTELIRLAVAIEMIRGEFLASVEWLKDKRRPCATALNFISLNRLSTSPSSVADSNVRDGVRFDQYGAPIAYQIKTIDPYDLGFGIRPLTQSMQWKEIRKYKPWGRLQMIHLFESQSPFQTRGIPEITAALKELRIAKTFRDIQLQKAVVQSIYAATIESELPTDQIAQSLGATGNTPTQEEIAEAVAVYSAGLMSAAKHYGDVKADGVQIPHLMPGTKFNLQTAAQGQDRGSEFEQSVLRNIAAALGMSYEQFSKDYTHTNYSSARAAILEVGKTLEARKMLVADKVANITYRLWMEEAVNNRQFSTLTGNTRRSGWLYASSLRLDALCNAEWIGASRGQIDELKETQASVLRRQAGLGTLESEAARQGLDWRKMLQQQKVEQDYMNELGITLGVSSTQKPTVASTATDDSEEDEEK